jgi:hypothetical protein
MESMKFLTSLKSLKSIGAASCATALALSTVTGYTQPSDAPDPAVARRFAAAARSSSTLMDVAREMTDVYGPRLTGSPHLRAAGGAIVKQLHSWGIGSARFERWGPYGPGWTTDRFVALAVAPAFYPLIAFPKAWTPGTPGEVVAEATLAPIATDSDFARYRGTLRGRFVLTAALHETAASRAPQTREALEFARRRMAFFIDEGVAALLEPGGEGGAVAVGDGRLRDDAAFGGNGFYPWPDAVATQVVLATEHYTRIGRMLAAGIPVTLELNVVSTYHTAEPDSFNIIAELPGTDLASQVVMLGAHFDSWHGGTGAVDNAAGGAVLLEALRILKASGLATRRTIRLALWTGSEQGLLGSRAYVTEHLADPSTMAVKPGHASISAYLNVDGGTGAIRGLSVQGNEAAAAVITGWIPALKDHGFTTVRLDTTRESDHHAFDAVGIPAFDFIQDVLPADVKARHTSADVFDRLRRDDLAGNAGLVAALAHHIANRAEPMPRKPLPKPDPAAAGPWSPGR